jgi:hypothetical protein
VNSKNKGLTSSATGPDDGVASPLPFAGVSLFHLPNLNSVARSGARGVRLLEMRNRLLSIIPLLMVSFLFSSCGQSGLASKKELTLSPPKIERQNWHCYLALRFPLPKMGETVELIGTMYPSKSKVAGCGMEACSSTDITRVEGSPIEDQIRKCRNSPIGSNGEMYSYLDSLFYVKGVVRESDSVHFMTIIEASECYQLIDPPQSLEIRDQIRIQLGAKLCWY